MPTNETEILRNLGPEIIPMPIDVARPFWSVMIPTYNSRPDLLEQALRSVLDQDPGPDRMQIALVDDASTEEGAERVAARLAPGRVEFHRQPRNVGLTANWNTCVAMARGHWVHLFHQDDLVRPGFYDRLGRAARERPDAGAAFCRHAFLEGDGRCRSVMAEERSDAGILEGWLARISQHQLIQCPSIVVRRAAYERLGGFRTDLCYALDWEMWVRIAAHYPVWYEPETLACFRSHEGSETARLRRLGATIPDIRRAIQVVRRYIPAGLRGSVGRELLAHFRWAEMAEALRLLDDGAFQAAQARVREACRNDPSLRFSRILWGYRKRALKKRLSGFLHAVAGGNRREL